MSARADFRDSVIAVLNQTGPDDPTAGPHVNYRQIANRLVQTAIAVDADPVPTVNLILQILDIPDDPA